MQFEVQHGDSFGTVEWRGPGDVAVEMPDPKQESWFSNYFRAEDSVMGGPVDCAEMSSGRRDSSEEAFQRAAFQLAAYAYKVRHKGDAARRSSYPQGSSKK
jgi:hypothetical protein